MTDAELIFTALAELSTRQIAEQDQADGFNQNALSAHKGGTVAGKARQLLEQQTGKPVVSGQNFTLPEKPKRRLLKRKPNWYHYTISKKLCESLQLQK